MPKPPSISEADLCKAFIALATKDGAWTAYPETAGFDILLVRVADGAQIGIEAKLKLNPHVVAQALPEWQGYYGAHTGPDYRAVLVPFSGAGAAGMSTICHTLGITILWLAEPDYIGRRSFGPELPVENRYGDRAGSWHEWAPAERCRLPDYVPDCVAGASSPITLTAWKVKAIKLAILLEERPVGRSDFKHLGLSPSRWTAPDGWLRRRGNGWIAGPGMPNLKRQHPRNYAEIAAEKATWAPPTPPLIVVAAEQGALL
ncbi:hypothetical protein [Methylobacterium symbioticum]|uniref:Uncharacterized protein n=1 Tax=Methylobacterium symbioticum TaxID=2584084 RepID=A0A509EC32_9HYPH|nr:hypothetical protein [Methylobacterium symbioticum]VUD71807.1 hypothetical protein MET9862_02395 [Methylobacterium symbioticum]